MMVTVAVMPAVTVVPAAMMHLLGGGYLVRRGAEARPERQRVADAACGAASAIAVPAKAIRMNFRMRFSLSLLISPAP